MKAVSLHAPWGSLCVTRQPCDCNFASSLTRPFKGEHRDLHSVVKRYETRSWPCPQNIIGQRIAIHQAKRVPTVERVGDYNVDKGYHDCPARMWRDGGSAVDLPLGAVVGSGIITASLDIVEGPSYRSDVFVSLWPDGKLWSGGTDISDQLPYGDWTPGRFAWQIEQAAPTTERCPRCWGEFDGKSRLEDRQGQRVRVWDVCPVCEDENRCGPIPATGRQGWWTWTS